ncbi:MAG TPA: DUF4149 domain-containing protein [Terriglobales bacterium]|nr:DUF4149 domain-containing protein [Terriglobales bacterium]
MALIRFLMWLSLIVWLGGIIFFAVLAPNAFTVLPTRQLAGNLVGRMLPILHWMGFAAGLLFLICSFTYSRVTTGDAHPFALRHLLLYFMLLLTSISQFGIMRKMDTLRKDMVNIDSISPDDPRRIQFNALHSWSSRVEIGVLLSGLIVVYLNSRNP